MNNLPCRFIKVFVFCTLFVLTLLSCSKRVFFDEDETYGEPIRIEQSITCHNDYLGFSWSFPRGWWLYDLNSANFSPDHSDTSDPSFLDIIYNDNFCLMELAHFSNLKSPGRKNHLYFYINAEFHEDSGSIGEYMAYLEENMLRKYEEDTVFLLISGVDDIGGVPFEKRIFEVSGFKDSFRIITLSTGVHNGYFLNIIVRYWPENQNAEFFIFDALDRALELE